MVWHCIMHRRDGKPAALQRISIVKRVNRRIQPLKFISYLTSNVFLQTIVVHSEERELMAWDSLLFKEIVVHVQA
jgi:hypothetical protein